MHVSEQGLSLIRQFEGFCPKPYLCPAGKLTIGYGHVVGAGEKFSSGGITPLEAEDLLCADVRYAEQALARLITKPLLQTQFDALIAFIYNIGAGNFAKSTMLYFINTDEFEKAASEFDRWVYVKGHKSAGLARRRAAERFLFLK